MPRFTSPVHVVPPLLTRGAGVRAAAAAYRVREQRDGEAAELVLVRCTRVLYARELGGRRDHVVPAVAVQVAERGVVDALGAGQLLVGHLQKAREAGESAR